VSDIHIKCKDTEGNKNIKYHPILIQREIPIFPETEIYLIR